MSRRTHRHDHGHGRGHAHGPIEGKASRRYDVLARSIMRVFYRRLAADIARAAPEGAAVLDVGTGPGVLLMELARHRPDLHLSGLDVSADMIAAAERNLAGKATIRTADVAALPYDDASFDLVTASLSAHHWEDAAAGAAEVARVLRPGCRLLVYDLAHAPFEALERHERFTDLDRGRFRSGLGPLLRCQRLSATAA